MLIFNMFEGFAILNGFKSQTCRGIRSNGKGYCRIGSIHEVRVNRDFKAPYLCKILITGRDFVNVDHLAVEDFRELGYPDRETYMEQPYNRGNPDPERVRYSFICLDTLWGFIDSLPWTPDTFALLWDYCRISPELSRGVSPDLVYEGCDLGDLEEQMQRLQMNIEGAM